MFKKLKFGALALVLACPLGMRLHADGLLFPASSDEATDLSNEDYNTFAKNFVSAAAPNTSTGDLDSVDSDTSALIKALYAVVGPDLEDYGTFLASIGGNPRGALERLQSDINAGSTVLKDLFTFDKNAVGPTPNATDIPNVPAFQTYVRDLVQLGYSYKIDPNAPAGISLLNNVLAANSSISEFPITENALISGHKFIAARTAGQEYNGFNFTTNAFQNITIPSGQNLAEFKANITTVAEIDVTRDENNKDAFGNYKSAVVTVSVKQVMGDFTLLISQHSLTIEQGVGQVAQNLINDLSDSSTTFTVELNGSDTGGTSGLEGLNEDEVATYLQDLANALAARNG